MASSATSKCVKVVVQTDAGAEKSTGPMQVSAGAVLRVAVYRDDLPATVSVQAQGYSDEACTARTVPVEESPRAAATFKQGIATLELLVDRGSAIDADGDTFSPPDDCNDMDPTIRPSATEQCADGVDNDCDQATDCADPDCHMQSCGSGAVCNQLTCKETNCADSTDGDHDQLVDCADPDCASLACGTGTGAVCVGTACQETICTDRVDNDLDTLTDCFEVGCLWQACSARGKCDAGLCVEPIEETCGDGLDNDADTFVDCADSDCLGLGCNDGNLCTTGETCAANNQCRNGTQVQCTGGADAGQCFDAVGTCNPTTGQCQYTASAVDAGCDDTDPCTVRDRCNGTGLCLSVAQTCAPKPAGPCFATGMCQASLDGGCSYAVNAGASCDDGNNCTQGDLCAADGGCAPGTATVCTPPDCKTFTQGSCDTVGACIFGNAAPNTSCGVGGYCDGNGNCGSTPVFPFVPDNIVPAQHLPGAAMNTVIDCPLTFVSGPSAAFGTLCAGMQAPAISVADGGAAGPLSVISVNHLFITDAGSLTLTGSYPVVLLVWGDAGISGPLLANTVTDAGRLGPGAAAPLGCLSRTGDAGYADGAHGGGGGGAAYATAGGLGGNGGGSSKGGAGGAAADGGDVPLFVGCPGGFGVDSTSAAVPGGFGGGAVQVVVAGGLTVESVVSVSGGGGVGGFNSGGTDPGGGGGGSGGTILLQASRMTVRNAARLTSNGGAGGGGADNSTGGQGAEGSTTSSTIAPAGTNQGGGGIGGTGGAGTTAPGAGASTSKGGGGGGGSVGRIFIKQTTASGCFVSTNATISPPATRVNCP